MCLETRTAESFFQSATPPQPQHHHLSLYLGGSFFVSGSCHKRANQDCVNQPNLPEGKICLVVLFHTGQVGFLPTALQTKIDTHTHTHIWSEGGVSIYDCCFIFMQIWQQQALDFVPDIVDYRHSRTQSICRTSHPNSGLKQVSFHSIATHIGWYRFEWGALCDATYAVLFIAEVKACFFADAWKMIYVSAETWHSLPVSVSPSSL